MTHLLEALTTISPRAPKDLDAGETPALQNPWRL